jgi:hypothetical protein
MDNIQVLRYLTTIENRLKLIELNNGTSTTLIASSINLNDFIARLTAIENRPQIGLNDVNACLATAESRSQVNFDDINTRLAALEARPQINVDDINTRLAALEARPDVMQRLSAVELTLASLNNS